MFSLTQQSEMEGLRKSVLLTTQIGILCSAVQSHFFMEAFFLSIVGQQPLNFLIGYSIESSIKRIKHIFAWFKSNYK